MDLLNDGTRERVGRTVMPPFPDDAAMATSSLSVEWPIELRNSLREMQGLICYLLHKNQQLRMELSATETHQCEPTSRLKSAGRT
jgi:hypothetical protein